MSTTQKNESAQNASRFVEITDDKSAHDRKVVRLYFLSRTGKQVDLLRLTDNAPGRATEIASRWAAQYSAEIVQ